MFFIWENKYSCIGNLLMSSFNYDSDLAIVGAGPAGSCAAWESLQHNSELSVSIFEEHKEKTRSDA